jgi:voltage-gated potassium channel
MAMAAVDDASRLKLHRGRAPDENPAGDLPSPGPSQSKLVRGSELAIQGLIVYSIIEAALETMPELAGWQIFFDASEAIVVALFTVEYLIRWCLARRKMTYPFTPLAIIDSAAVLPFYLSAGVDLRALRILTLLRVLRVFKLGRYNQALHHLIKALAMVKRELAVFGFAASIVMLVAATGIYFAEYDAQPDKFNSIPACMWWAVVTLTTVGYGDLVPITPLGKLFASLVMVMGIGIVAIPTGLISSAMTELARRNRHGEGYSLQ